VDQVALDPAVHHGVRGLITGGVPSRLAAADLLGHSSIAITGNVYGHTSDDTARTAVDGLAARLGL
jgi:integrase